MTEDEIDELFNETKLNIPSLTNCQFMISKRTVSKFENLCKKLQELLEEVKTDFPDACYFVEGESGLHLMLGSPGGDSSARLDKMHRTACTSNILEITGGAI